MLLAWREFPAPLTRSPRGDSSEPRTERALQLPSSQSLSRLAFAVGTCLVIAGSLIPVDAVPAVAMWDKLAHTFAYAVLASLGLVGFRGGRAWLVVATGLLLLGAALEYLQSFVPGRSPGPGDVAANALGVALGLLVARFGFCQGRGSEQ